MSLSTLFALSSLFYDDDNKYDTTQNAKDELRDEEERVKKKAKKMF